ncbi:hypothetical protein F0L74_05150 [Chitinophaga agrisoli]|uniref:O-antigen/teichoic acid export membrane protein n=1 Tax=Chitinophaga agrisoli TaxID=2607653 RepID=A0A5B2W0Y7_9BACT|nr:hypothetical protein [Chitinophaga agrisoli]KAA2245351.1 hypothetical protein F0L74_05150 [Chitinophaga agrisoli]
MKYLDFYDLGLIGIVQILIMIMSMLQLGMVTGGYKAYSILQENFDINNTITSYVMVMLGISLPILILTTHSGSTPAYIAVFGILIGALSLYNNWLTCMMLAKGDIKPLNTINLISASASFITLPAIVFWKLHGVLLGTATAPILFCITAMIKVPYLRPFRFTLSRAMIRKLLYYGFVPYLTSTFLYINIQIERWAIVKVMGVEELGRLSLCVIISAAFMIVPNSVSNLYFPTAMRTFAEGDFQQFRLVIRRYTLVIAAYGVAFVTATALLVRILVPFFFPKHVPQIHLVYWMLPSLFFMGFNTIPIIIFNAAFKYRAIITVNIIGLLCMAGGIFGILQFHNIQLYYFIVVESSVATISFLTALGVYLKIRRRLYAPKKKPESDLQNGIIHLSDLSQ